MNTTLEAMARAIFKSWFVDFDPVYAKMEGRDYPLPPEIMDLFPDELEESELGMIPKGWRVGKLENFNITMGQSPLEKHIMKKAKDCHFIKAGEILVFVIHRYEFFVACLND